MLILNRRSQESIVITPPGMEPITIFILSIGDRNVRIGLKADKEITIMRGELLDNPPTLAHWNQPLEKSTPVAKPFSFRPGRDS